MVRATFHSMWFSTAAGSASQVKWRRCDAQINLVENSFIREHCGRLRCTTTMSADQLPSGAHRYASNRRGKNARTHLSSELIRVLSLFFISSSSKEDNITFCPCPIYRYTLRVPYSSCYIHTTANEYIWIENDVSASDCRIVFAYLFGRLTKHVISNRSTVSNSTGDLWFCVHFSFAFRFFVAIVACHSGVYMINANFRWQTILLRWEKWSIQRKMQMIAVLVWNWMGCRNAL